MTGVQTCALPIWGGGGEGEREGKGMGRNGRGSERVMGEERREMGGEGERWEGKEGDGRGRRERKEIGGDGEIEKEGEMGGKMVIDAVVGDVTRTCEQRTSRSESSFVPSLKSSNMSDMNSFL